MAKYQIRQLSDDSILYKYEADEPQSFGGPWGNSNLFANELMSEENVDQEANDAKMKQLRLMRDTKLADVDTARYDMVWAEQSGGNPWSQEDKDAWATYRQELLDVPNDVEDVDALDLESFEWPTKP